MSARPERPRPGPERGSAFIGALVLLFVLTILGLALFDSALIDAQLALVSVDEHRALESAEAGLQRAMHRLYRDLCGRRSGHGRHGRVREPAGDGPVGG